MSTVIPDFTVNSRVGPGSKLFPDTPNDIQSFVPNDGGFPQSPVVTRFVPGENGELDYWVSVRPRQQVPSDFVGKIFARIREDHENSKPLPPPMSVDIVF